jgi:hypothetical protein
MNYEEVKMAFLGYYEKRLKLQLLAAELQNIIGDAQTMLIPSHEWESKYPTNSFSLNVIETILVDTYTIVAEQPDLVEAIMRVRNPARSINNLLANMRADLLVSKSDSNARARSYNEALHQRCPLVIKDAQQALEILQKLLAK